MRLREGLCPSLTAEVLDKLKAVEVTTVTELLLRDCEELATETSISYTELRSIRRAVIAIHVPVAMTGLELLKQEVENTIVFSTGSKDMDELLEGGLMTGEVVEVCGEPGEGKTSLCLRLALQAVCDHDVSVLYIDTLGAVIPYRINPLIEALAKERQISNETLSHIKVVRAFDVWELFSALTMAAKPFFPIVQCGAGSGEEVTLSKIKLVIVDTLTSILRPLKYADPMQCLAFVNQIAMQLKTVAKEQHAAVVVVKYVVEEDEEEEEGEEKEKKGEEEEEKNEEEKKKNEEEKNEEEEKMEREKKKEEKEEEEAGDDTDESKDNKNSNTSSDGGAGKKSTSNDTNTASSSESWVAALHNFWETVPHVRLHVKLAEACLDEPVLMTKDSEGIMSARSPLQLEITMLMGRRMEVGTTVVCTFPPEPIVTISGYLPHPPPVASPSREDE